MDFSKVFKFTLVLAVFGSKILEPLEYHYSTTPNIKALNDVINILFGDFQYNFAVLPDALESNAEILSVMSSQFKPRLLFSYYISTVRNYIINIQSMVMFIFSCKDFEIFFRGFFVSHKHFEDLKLLIYVENCGFDYIYDRIIYASQASNFTFRSEILSVYFAYFLIDAETSIDFASVESFTDRYCNKQQLIVLNSFNKFTQMWNEKLENYENFRNFHGCNLKLFISKSQNITCWSEFLEMSEYLTANGLVPKLFKLLAEKFNFTAELCQIDEEFCEACVQYDIGWIWNQRRAYKVPLFMERRDLIIVTPTEYTFFEELIKPLNFITSVPLAVSFVGCICFGLIFIQITRLLQAHQISKIRTVIGNLRVPNMGFMRISVILILFSSLILRALYQNGIFVDITTQKKPSQPRTLKELRNKNYSILTSIPEDIFQKFYGKSITSSFKIKHAHDFELIKYLYMDPNKFAKNTVLIISSETVNLYDYKSLIQSRWKKLSDYSVIQMGFQFSTRFFPYKHIKEIINQLAPAGILHELVKDCVLISFKYTFSDPKWKAINVMDLKFAFIIWIVCCGVSVVVLILEIFHRRPESVIENL